MVNKLILLIKLFSKQKRFFLEIKAKNLYFASRIKLKRRELGFTQKDLAGLLDVNIGTIRNYEAGLLPKGGYIIILSKVLHCSIDWLLMGVGPENIEQGAVSGSGATSRENNIVREQSVEYKNNNQSKISDLITKTVSVLESDTIYRHALTSNINAFHHSILLNAKLEKMEMRLYSLESTCEKMKNRLAEAEKEAHSRKKNAATQG